MSSFSVGPAVRCRPVGPVEPSRPVSYRQAPKNRSSCSRTWIGRRGTRSWSGGDSGLRRRSARRCGLIERVFEDSPDLAPDAGRAVDRQQPGDAFAFGDAVSARLLQGLDEGEGLAMAFDAGKRDRGATVSGIAESRGYARCVRTVAGSQPLSALDEEGVDAGLSAFRFGPGPEAGIFGQRYPRWQ